MADRTTIRRERWNDARPELEGTSAKLGTVLVADDEPGVRRALALALTNVGYEVLEAATTSACIELFREHAETIAAVMVDLQMPGGGGREVVRALRADGHRVPVVVASGYIADTIGRELSADPRLALLEKPFELPTLIWKLRAAIAMK